MTRRFLRVLFGPIGGAVFTLLAIAAAWTGWWLLPPISLKKFPIDSRVANSQSNRLVGRSALFAFSTRSQCGWQLVRLSDGKVLASDDCGLRGGVSPNGELLVCHSGDQLVALETATGRELRRSESCPFDSATARINGSPIRFSADGRRFAALTNAGVTVFETSTLRPIARFKNEGAAFDLSADGKLLLAQDFASAQLCLFDIDTQQIVASFLNDEPAVLEESQLSPRGDFVAAFANRILPPDTEVKTKGQIIIWECQHCARVLSLPSSVGDIHFSPDGRFMTAGYREGRTVLLDLDANPPIKVGQDFSERGILRWASIDGARILTYDREGNWQVHDTTSRATIAQGSLNVEDTSGFRIGFSPAGEWLWLNTKQPPTANGKISVWLEKLTGWHLTFITRCEFINAKSGQTRLNLGDRWPVLFDDKEETVWTVSIGSFRGGGTFELEQWPLRSQGPPWWLWLCSAIGVLVILRLIFRRRAISRNYLASPVA